jgi:myo-inositol-1(or 4)-monophosphatase
MNREDSSLRRYLQEAIKACGLPGGSAAAFGSAPLSNTGLTSSRRRPASEKTILAIIGRAFPGHGVLAEESDPRTGDAEHLWVVDPLDGTTNYSRGFPYFCVSVALARAGRVVVAAVYQPLLDEMFTAIRGHGAFLNGSRLRVSGQAYLEQAFLATGFPYDIRRSRRTNIDHFSAFATRCLAIRRAGAAALDLAYVAAGRFDGFWELKLRPWDIAAASLLVEEAGGRVTGLAGRPWRLSMRDIVASNGRVHHEMLAVLRGGQAIAGT